MMASSDTGIMSPRTPVSAPLATQSPDVRVDTGLCSLNQEQYKATFTQQPAWEIKANISRFILDCRGS